MRAWGEVQRNLLKLILVLVIIYVIITPVLAATYNTTTVVTSSVNPSVYGQTVTFTATVTSTGTPQGNVKFEIDGTNVSTVSLSSGKAVYSTSTLSKNTHTIKAYYLGGSSGGNTYRASSGTLSGGQIVNKAATSTALSSSANPSVSGQSVTFTATVSPTAPGAGTPTGTVTFKDGGTTLGTGTLSGGIATYTASALTVASHSITAVYGGNTNFLTSTSSTLTQTVNKAATSISVTTSKTPTVFGEPVTFTATVSAVAPGTGSPTGTVQFKDGAGNLGSAITLDGTGKATFTSSTLNVASHSITAVYSSDTNFAASTSPVLSQTVNKAATTTGVTTSKTPTVFGESVTFTATVNATSPSTGTPTGTVQFRDGGNNIGSPVTLDDTGKASISPFNLSVASHTITAVYNGDANFLTSTFSSLTQIINKASTTTSVTTSKNQTVFGEPVTFTATVLANAPGAGTPTGWIQFRDGITNLGVPVALDGTGNATSPGITSLSWGSHSIVAVYIGDAKFLTSTSGSTMQTVNKASTTYSINSSQNPSVTGQSVNFTATVSPVAPGAGTPTGIIQFKDGLNNLGSPVTLDSTGKGTITGIVTLTAGSHIIKVQYSGDSNFTTPYTFTTLTQNVSQASTTVNINSSVNPSDLGQPISFNATVNAVSPGTGIPTGTVEFKDNGISLGFPVPLDGTGRGTISGIASLTAGSHAITAVYNGDSNFITSTSSPVTQNVNKALTLTSLSSSLNSSVYGQPVAFTATVNSSVSGLGLPTGTVQFKDGTTNLGSPVNLDGTGQATSPGFSALTVKSHAITVEYSGDTNFIMSMSTALTQNINKSSTTTLVSSSNNPSEEGRPLHFIATVSAVPPGDGLPTGTVQFKNGTLDFGAPVALDGTGRATSPDTTSLLMGSYQISARYNGDSNFAISVSPTITQTVLVARIPDLAAIKVTTGSPDGWLVANGSDSGTIELNVSRGGTPIPNLTVNFSVNDTRLGSITPVTAFTDQNGVARAVFKTTKKSGTATIYGTVYYNINDTLYSMVNSTLQPIDHDTPYRISSYIVDDEVTVGTNTTLSIGLSDKWGNPVDNIRKKDSESIFFEVASPSSRTPGPLSIPAVFCGTQISNITVPVNSTGYASVNLSVDTKPGANIIYVKPLIETIPSRYFTIQGIADGIPWYLGQSIDPPSLSIPAHQDFLFNITYVLMDRWGNGLGNHAIIWNSTYGDNEIIHTNHLGWALRTFGPNTYEGVVTIRATADENRSLIQTASLSFTNTSAVDMVLTASPQTMASSDLPEFFPAQIDAKVIDIKGNPVAGQAVTFTINSVSHPAQVRDPSFSDESIQTTVSAVTNEYGIARVNFWSGAFQTDSTRDNYDDQASANCTVRAEWVNTAGGGTVSRNLLLEWKNYPYLTIKTSANPITLKVNESVDINIKLIGDGWKLQPKPIDVVLLLDDSGSMGTETDGTTRVHKSKEAAKTFVAQLNQSRGDRIGVIYYNYDAYTLVPLTNDFTGVNGLIDGLDEKPPVGTHTRMRYALYKAISMVSRDGRTYAVKSVIHMTDGDWSMGGDPLARGNGFDIPFTLGPMSIHSVWAGNVVEKNGNEEIITNMSEYFEDLGGGSQHINELVMAPNGQPYDNNYNPLDPWHNDNYESTQNLSYRLVTYYSDTENSSQNMSVYASKNKVKLYSLSFLQIPRNTTKYALINMANTTGGFYQHAPDTASLENLYKKIAGELKEEAGVNVSLDVNLNNVEINSTPWSGGAVFDYLHSAKSTYIDNYYTNTTPVTHLPGYPTNPSIDQSNNWTNASHYTLHFYVGTVRINQIWEANYTLKVKTDGNIDLFGPDAFLTFNQNEQMKVPSVFITAAYNMTNISISQPVLELSEISVINLTNYSREWTWTRNYNGTGNLTEKYYLSVDNGMQWILVGQNTMSAPQAQTEKNGAFRIDLRTVEKGVENSDKVIFRVEARAEGAGSPVRKQKDSSRPSSEGLFIKLK